MKNSIQHIHAFLAVARTGSFTKAANELHLSPSALTVQVQQLEDWLGVALLDRSPRHVSITAAGQDARGPMEKLLLDLDNIVTGSRDLAALAPRRGDHRRPALGVRRRPAAGFCACFANASPASKCACMTWSPTAFMPRCAQGEVDFGIGVRARLSHGLEFLPVLNDRLCAFVPLDHPLAHHRQLTLEQLADSADHPDRARQQCARTGGALFDETRLTLNAGMEANYMSTVLALVRQGLGISVLPESADDGRDDLVKVPVDHPGVTRSIGLITRTGQTMAPAALRFIQMLQSTSTGVHKFGQEAPRQ